MDISSKERQRENATICCKSVRLKSNFSLDLDLGLEPGLGSSSKEPLLLISE